MKLLKAEEWAWIAGIIEGEGCFSTTEKNPHPLFGIQMVDEDIIARLAELLDVKYSHRPSKNENHKDIYQIYVRRRSFMEWLFQNIYQYMSIRRKAKINKCIAFYQSKGFHNLDHLLSTSA